MKIENDRGKKESNSNSLGVIAMIISGVALVCCLYNTVLAFILAIIAIAVLNSRVQEVGEGIQKKNVYVTLAYVVSIGVLLACSAFILINLIEVVKSLVYHESAGRYIENMCGRIKFDLNTPMKSTK